MSAISTWSTTAGSNNSAAPNGFPENMAPSGLNDAAREVMAQVRTWYEEPEWINDGGTYTRSDGDTVTVSSVNVTSTYHAGRRVRGVGSNTGTIYGTVSSSSFSSNTTINFVFDTGSIHSGDSTVTISYSVLSADSQALPPPIKGTDVASTAALPVDVQGLFHDVTGTATVTSLNTLGGNGTSAPMKILQFDASLTLTHHATNLLLPGGQNIVTGAGDVAGFYEYASGDWICMFYTRAVKPRVRVHYNDTGGPTIATDTATKLTFSTEEADIGGYYSSGAWTPPAGTYVVTAQAYIAPGIGNMCWIGVYVDGDSVRRSVNRSPTTSKITVNISSIVTVNGAEAIEIYLRQDSGSSVALSDDVRYTWMEGIRVD